MSDPIGIVGSASVPPTQGVGSSSVAGGAAASGRAFEKEFLSEVARQIDEVNRLQSDADLAAEDLVTGRRSDVEGVMIATQKADTAFRMLLAVRNRMMEAYEEVKQIRI